jgi:glyoxylase-like metal-dependent hydrolase (beta-lactamase superfamily II)
MPDGVTELVPGVHRLGSDVVNWYVVEADGRLTVVDAGLPAFWDQFAPALARIGRSPDDVAALVLTHAHADHTGVAGRLHDRGVPVYLHAADHEMLRTGKQQKRDSSLLPHLRRTGAWRLFWYMGRNGGLKPPKIEDPIAVADGDELDLPGRPRVIHTPGHTLGHCAVHFSGPGALLVGDLLCTWNPLTGRIGPQIMPSAFNNSSEQSLGSLDRIERLQASVVLPGHGEPWTQGVEAAVARAREAGTS